MLTDYGRLSSLPSQLDSVLITEHGIKLCEFSNSDEQLGCQLSKCDGIITFGKESGYIGLQYAAQNSIKFLIILNGLAMEGKEYVKWLLTQSIPYMANNNYQEMTESLIEIQTNLQNFLIDNGLNNTLNAYVGKSPSSYLAQIKCPVLGINGTNDRTIPWYINLEEYVKYNGHPKSCYVPALNLDEYLCFQEEIIPVLAMVDFKPGIVIKADNNVINKIVEWILNVSN